MCMCRGCVTHSHLQTHTHRGCRGEWRQQLSGSVKSHISHIRFEALLYLQASNQHHSTCDWTHRTTHLTFNWSATKRFALWTEIIHKHTQADTHSTCRHATDAAAATVPTVRVTLTTQPLSSIWQSADHLFCKHTQLWTDEDEHTWLITAYPEI